MRPGPTDTHISRCDSRQGRFRTYVLQPARCLRSAQISPRWDRQTIRRRGNELATLARDLHDRSKLGRKRGGSSTNMDRPGFRADQRQWSLGLAIGIRHGGLPAAWRVVADSDLVAIWQLYANPHRTHGGAVASRVSRYGRTTNVSKAQLILVRRWMGPQPSRRCYYSRTSKMRFDTD